MDRYRVRMSVRVAVALGVTLLAMNAHATPDVTPHDTSELATALEAAGLAPVHWKDLSLNRDAKRLSTAKMRKIGLQHPHVGFEWQDDDGSSEDWYPQGITGLRIGETKKFVVVSWYAKHEDAFKGVRLSFVDVTDMDHITYRHVILVEPSGDAKLFKAVKIHAGGLASIGDTIFVADTNHGIRAFDASRMFKVQDDPDKTKIGVIGGKAYAFDYLYILPQTTKYEMNGPEFSFADIDWSDPELPSLVTGTYHNPGDDNRTSSLVWWRLQGDRIVSKLSDLESPKDLMQGAASLRDALFLSCSGSPAHFYVRWPRVHLWKTYTWPHGAEDVHISIHSENLWSLSEHPKERYVWAVKYLKYIGL